MVNRLAGLLVGIALSSAAAAADVESGRAVFQVCQACHSSKPGETGIGPTLAGIVGRRAGSLPGYDYSAAMKAAGAKGLIWDRKTLGGYLTNPSSYLPGIKMTLAGLPDPQDREDLIAYLGTLKGK